MTEIPPISHCIGDYEAEETICNGDGKGDEPCSWKDRCVAFQRHLKATKEDIEKYVKPREIPEEDGTVIADPVNGPVSFAAFCDELIEKEAQAKKEEKQKRTERNKRAVTRLDKRRKGPSRTTKAAAKVALQKRAKERRESLMSVFETFKSELKRCLPECNFATYGQVVMPGQFYVVDRMKSSDYLSLYCRSKQGWDDAIVSFQFRTASLTFDAFLPIEFDVLKKNFNKKTFKKLNPKEMKKNGKFKLIIKRVGVMESALLAEGMAKLIKNGIIPLPVMK